MTHTSHPGARRLRLASANAAFIALAVMLGACSTPPTTSVTPTSATAAAAPGGGRATASAEGAAAAPDASASAAVAAAAAAAAEAARIADATPAPKPVPVDPVRPDEPVKLDDRRAQIVAQMDLWDRVRRGFALPDLESDLVRDREAWYATRPDYVQRMTERGGRYLFHIVEELERRGMPTELALLPFIESAFNPQAISSAKASGMWQFMAATGRDFSLKQNIFRDDRRDVLASTRAALDYLSRLHGTFGDWHLALAAYNWGEGSVSRAIARNQKAGLPTDYASLKMPDETRLYVPKLQAVKNIVARPKDFGLTLPVLANHPYFLSVPIERDMDVAVAAKLAGIPLETFHTLNPQMNKPVILAAGTPQVLLPYDNAAEFTRRLPMHRGPLASWTAWIAPKTMRTAEAARQVGMDEDTLREVNRIPLRMLVTAGSTLLVTRAETRRADVTVQVADNASMTLAPDVPPLRRLSIRAGKRDNVASVARRYKVGAQQVAAWNSVAPNASFKPGESLVVFVANKGTARPATHTAGRGAATRTAARPAARLAAKPAPVRRVAGRRGAADGGR
ncbi:MAG: transglycosylase SLT domain-containing protein [Burkholderiaceae bacterium]